MGRGEEAKLAIAEAPGAGPIQSFLADMARELGPVDRGRHGAGPGRRRAARRGRLPRVSTREATSWARYDKIHLFDVDVPGKTESHRESTLGAARIASPSSSTRRPAGSGLAVCYDLRFPELFRALLDQGAEWFCLPSAFTVPTGRAHWEILLRARAIENLCHLVAPAQSGFHENGRETHGDSMIVEPWGRVLARLPRGTGVITAELDFARQRRLRQDFPVVEHRRLPPGAPRKEP